MYISLNIPPIIYILLSVSLGFSLIFILWDFLNFRLLKKSVETSSKLKQLTTSSPCNESCGVSVIIYSNNSPSSLAKSLQAILNQDYPLYEVIVVNNGKNEYISNYIENLSLQHPNLHYSFTPDDARNISRKKLALMIGIKAAKYDIILTTNCNCTPKTEHWISTIARHFMQGKDVVIGHSIINSSTRKLSVLRSFLALKNTLKYLVHALRHKPYCGTSNNLAYRKSTFFKNKGFSRSMHLHYGEDDLFVNEIATHDNTAIEISPESMVIANYDNPDKEFSNQKLYQAFSARRIRSSAPILCALQSFLYIANLLILCSVIILEHLNVVTILVPILIATITATLQIIIYRKTAAILHYEKLLFSIPIFTLIQPLVNTYYKLKSRRHTSYFYTWQPLRS